MAKTRGRVSIILPCLNEEITIARCIREAKQGLTRLARLGYAGEIIVADNGSTDTSQKISRRMGARLVVEPRRGYGYAYLAGLRVARGDYIVIGDSDGTYKLTNLVPFITKLNRGADLVLGSRFAGTIRKNAMSPTHRYIGNPLLTGMLNFFYQSRVSDAHTGMRAFTKRAYRTMHLKSHGMEFASEMIVKAIFHHLRIEEVAITYYPRKGVSKLSPLFDAWRHIKFMLLFAPTYAFVIPGASLLTLGFGISTALLLSGGVRLASITFMTNTMAVGILIAHLGLYTTFMGIFARLYTSSRLRLPGGPLGAWLLARLSAQRLLIAGLMVSAVGVFRIAIFGLAWAQSGFGPFLHIPGVVYFVGITIMGIQCIFSSFLYGLLSES